MSVIFSFSSVPDSRLIRSVRASINVVSITAAAASLSSSSPCRAGGGGAGRRKGGGGETGRGRGVDKRRDT